MIKGTTDQPPKYQPIGDIVYLGYSATKTFFGKGINHVIRNFKTYFVGGLLLAPGASAHSIRQDNKHSSDISMSERQVVQHYNSLPVVAPQPSNASTPETSNENTNYPTMVRDKLENNIKNALNISIPLDKLSDIIELTNRIINKISNDANKFWVSYQVNSFNIPDASIAFSLKKEASQYVTSTDVDESLDLREALQNKNEQTNKKNNNLLKHMHTELKEIIDQISPNDTPDQIEYFKNKAYKAYAEGLYRLEKQTINSFHNEVTKPLNKSHKFDKKMSDAYSHMLDVSIENIIKKHKPNSNTEINDNENITLDLMIKYYMDRSDFSNPSYMKSDSDAKNTHLCFKMIKSADYLSNFNNNMMLPRRIKSQMRNLSSQIKSTSYKLLNALKEKEKLILSAKENHEYANKLAENKKTATKEIKDFLEKEIIASGSIPKNNLDEYIADTQKYTKDIIDNLSAKNKESNVEHLKTDEIQHQRKLIKQNKKELKKLRKEYKQMILTVYESAARSVVKEAIAFKKWW